MLCPTAIEENQETSTKLEIEGKSENRMKDGSHTGLFKTDDKLAYHRRLSRLTSPVNDDLFATAVAGTARRASLCTDPIPGNT